MTRVQRSFFARGLRLCTAIGVFAISSLLVAVSPYAFGVRRAAAQAEGAPEQAGEQEDPAQSRSAAFQAVEGSPTEDIPGGPLLVYAYAFILAAAVVYIARLGRLQGKNRAELERLGRLLERARKD